MNSEHVYTVSHQKSLCITYREKMNVGMAEKCINKYRYGICNSKHEYNTLVKRKGEKQVYYPILQYSALVGHMFGTGHPRKQFFGIKY